MNKPSRIAERPPPRPPPSPAPQPQGGMDAAARGRARPDDERPHLAALPHRRRQAARPGRRDARRRPAERRRGGARGRAGGRRSRSRRSRSSPTPRLRSRTSEGSEALNEGNLVCRACRAIKREFPELGLVTDVALDPYTSHGHDGLVRETASGEVSKFSTTRRSRRWCARRSTRRAPAPTSSRPPT